MTFKRLTYLLILVLGFGGQIMAQSAYDLLEQGRNAYKDYDFDETSRLYGQAKKKAPKGDEQFTQLYNLYNRQLSTAENFLDRIEKIEIIDSITVPRNDFFKYYRLPQSAGYLGDASSLPFRSFSTQYVFSNESDDYKLWSATDSVGRLQIVESTLLTDGNWSEPTSLGENLSPDSDAVYPFMMSDGVTLYYASNGENSIGGYDIMVATRDAGDGTFLQPSNIGFPYNSPFDDYLLAIDELNGVGWWATDRNQLDDKLTIYVFVVNDLRQNYSPEDTDDLIGFARIDDYIATQPEDADYEDIQATLRSIQPGARAKKAEFNLPASGGRVYHRYDELPDSQAKAAAKKYFQALTALENAENELTALRKRFHDYPSESLGARIRKEESSIQNQRSEVLKLRSDLYKSL